MTERKCFVFKFADVEVREREFLLIKAGERIAVEPKAFRVLLFLLQNPGRLITKDEIVSSVWNDSVVSDNSLTRSIAQLRRVLGDDSREPLYILTVPTIGYRFLCEVNVEDDGFGAPSVPSALPAGNENISEPTRGTLSRTLLFTRLAAALLLLLVAGSLIHRALSGHRDAGHTVAYSVIEHRVTSNPPEDPVQDAIVSPDGKYVAYHDPTGLYLRQISSGETLPWRLPKDFVAWPNSWFPDSGHLLVVRIEGQPQGLALWKPSLYKLSLLGGDPQKIMDDAAAGSVSPDGSRIVYLPGPNVASEIWVMDSDGANPRKVVSAGVLDKPGSNGSWIFPPVWAPNGQHVAYIERHVVAGSEPVEPAVALLSVDPNGGSPTVVLDDPRIGRSLWWAADGRVLFAYREDPASKKENYGVYSIRIDERTGKAAGPPQPITEAEGGIERLSAAADGKRLVLWRANAPDEAFIAKFDALTHQFKEPRRLTLDENENFADAWTADSKAVLMVSNRTGTFDLFKQGIAESTPRVLVEGGTFPRLSADGLQVLYLSASKAEDASLPESLMSKPLAGGTPHVVLKEKRIINYQCSQAPSKLCIFSNLAGNDLIFRSFDLEHGAGREVARIPNGMIAWTLSPDGSKLGLFLDEHRIRFISLDTGVAHEVTVKDWPLYQGDWSANSKSVFMPSVTSKGIPVILEVDQAGKANVVLQGSANTSFVAMIQSPDEKYGLLLEATPAENNAWMIDNF